MSSRPPRIVASSLHRHFFILAPTLHERRDAFALRIVRRQRMI